MLESELLVLEFRGFVGEKADSLKKIGLVKYRDQNKVLTEMLDFTSKGGGLREEAQILLIAVLMNRSEVNEILEKITPVQKNGLKVFLKRDWGWIKDFGGHGGLERIFTEDEVKDLQRWAYGKTKD